MSVSQWKLKARSLVTEIVINTFVVKEVFRESQHTWVDAADEQTQKTGTDEKEGTVRVEDEQKQLSHDHSNLQEEQ